LLGEDTNREGLEKTPLRVAKAMQFLTQGYNMKPEEIIRSAMFREDYQQMVVVKDIELYSMCEHHMLPFFGKAHVAYIPRHHITGLSKIARVVEAFARRLQVQERLTTQIKECIQDTLNPWALPWLLKPSTCACRCGVYKSNTLLPQLPILQVRF
jgi:GTP cyclohydrolase IA